MFLGDTLIELWIEHSGFGSLLSGGKMPPFLCWAQEQVRGSRWVLVEDAVDMFARQDPRFLPLLLPS